MIDPHLEKSYKLSPEGKGHHAPDVWRQPKLGDRLSDAYLLSFLPFPAFLCRLSWV